MKPTATSSNEQRPPTDSPAAGKPALSRRSRSWFWPGFVAGFLLLNLVSCGGLFLVAGGGRLDLVNLQNDQVAWSPPPVTPTSEQPAAAADDNTSPEEVESQGEGRFQLGDQPRNVTSSRVNIRQEPGYLGKPEEDVLGQVPPGEVVEIVGDHATADNLTWWHVRYVAPDGGVIQGWMAEATASGVQILAP